MRGRSPNSEAPSSGTVMPSSIGRMLAKCCSASTSVGAMNAPWWPPSTAVSSAAIATTVLPAPTSPCSNRCMGIGRARSLVISAITLVWSPVSSKGSAAEEPWHERAGGDVLDAHARGLDHALAQHQRQLDPQQLVEHEAAARLLRLSHRLGHVHATERRRAVDEVVPVEHPGGQRLDELSRASQRLGDPAAEIPRVQAQLVGLRVERRDLQTILLVEEVDLRVGQLLLAPVVRDLAEEQRLGCPPGTGGPATAG